MSRSTPRRRESRNSLGWILYYTIFGAAGFVGLLFLSRGQYLPAAMILLPFVAVVLVMIPDLRRYWLPEMFGGE